MQKLKPLSGKKCIQILIAKFNFTTARQKGSHVMLTNTTTHTGTVVPLHKELKIPTLRNILKLARVSENEFSKHY